jgi:hypothetical protein
MYLKIFQYKFLDDPQSYGYNRSKHRDFLKNESNYVKVIEFEDPEILQQIHLNFRISYLKDSVVGSIVDDPLLNQFTTVFNIK